MTQYLPGLTLATALRVHAESLDTPVAAGDESHSEINEST